MAGSDSKSRWIMWAAGIAISFLTIVALAYASDVDGDLDDVKDNVKANTKSVSELNERTGMVETHIKYIREGVERLEKDAGTLPRAPKKK